MISEILRDLATWTPYLLGGFMMNILISIVAMVIGTSLGWGLALMRLAQSPPMLRTASLLTEITRNTPTFVFQFYLAFMLPNELSLPFTELIIAVPPWIKASLALALAVIGFCSDNLTPALRAHRRGDDGAALLFIPSWTSYALVIVMASSTASVIGVSELLARCNTVVNATGKSELLLPIYLYACVVFVGFCYPLTLLMKLLKIRIANTLLKARQSAISA
jgi:polar amino acid transport system permease protein